MPLCERQGLEDLCFSMNSWGFVLYLCNPWNWNNALSETHFLQKCSPDESWNLCTFIQTQRQCLCVCLHISMQAKRTCQNLHTEAHPSHGSWSWWRHSSAFGPAILTAKLISCRKAKNKQTNKPPSHHGTFEKYFPRAKWLFPLPHKLAAKSGTVLKTSHACRIRYKICRKAGTYFLTTVCSSHISQLLSSLM